MRSESVFSSFVYKELSAFHKEKKILLRENQNILTDCTCVYEKKSFEFILGFAQTDLAFFLETKFEKSKQPPELFKFYGDKAIKEGVIAIPLVVLELKCGDTTTDSIRSRDFVASRIREMYPFSAYYFLAENTKKEEKTVLRQGKSFTNYFISKQTFNADDIQKIYSGYIKPHLDNVKSQFNF